MNPKSGKLVTEGKEILYRFIEDGRLYSFNETTGHVRTFYSKNDKFNNPHWEETDSANSYTDNIYIKLSAKWIKQKAIEFDKSA